ncbi:ornithine cyclodeaminase family protein [Lentibacillus amyloliquefaciens]|uniref:Ornithine cyclodeaminase n=1 Tax=Lentibacillus amyloliquefaciens TaxID=1472767 RepID=A0A0U3WD71_9BACI|nr:ornithine cyclodeaminase family protein [Lentibacillus amyloliquefaciens]ALX47743.1 hypothetical protein AOX59_03455 [Lentibacillus amyloliquefaciens]
MTLYLTENDVVSLLPMNNAIQAVESGLIELGYGRAQNQPRHRVSVGNTLLNTMSASMQETNILGVKNYATTPEGPKAYFLLFSDEAELLCLMEADELGRIRTGATTAMSTNYLARFNAKTLTMIGTGFQAETQLKAISEVRDLDKVRVWSRRESSVQNFCQKLQSEIQAEIVPTSNLQTAVQGADIVTTVTSATEPVFNSEWLSEGVHLNAVGNNKVNEREIDSLTIQQMNTIVTDSIEQSKTESGDLVIAAQENVPVWDRVGSLSDLVTGSDYRRKSNSQMTMFKSNGLAIEDLAVAYHVYQKAKESGAGTDMNI